MMQNNVALLSWRWGVPGHWRVFCTMLDIQCCPSATTTKVMMCCLPSKNQLMGRAAAIAQQHLHRARAFITSPLCAISHLMHFYQNKPAPLRLLNKRGRPCWSSNKYPDGTGEKREPANWAVSPRQRSRPKCEMNMKINDTWIHFLPHYT